MKKLLAFFIILCSISACTKTEKFTLYVFDDKWTTDAIDDHWKHFSKDTEFLLKNPTYEVKRVNDPESAQIDSKLEYLKLAIKYPNGFLLVDSFNIESNPNAIGMAFLGVSPAIAFSNYHTVFAHEYGHHLGLLHTNKNRCNYMYPILSRQCDWFWTTNQMMIMKGVRHIGIQDAKNQRIFMCQ